MVNINLPIIVPVALTQTNWEGFVKNLPRSPVRLLDQMSMSIGDLSSYIVALAAFSENADIKTALVHRPALLEHVSCSFMIMPTTNEYIEILREGYVHCLDNIDARDEQLVVIMSGTVREWHDSCKVFCSTDHTFRVRYIFDWIFMHLERMKIFSGSTKKFLTDETFILPE